MTDQEWSAVLYGGVRSIQDIVAHIGVVKFMYPISAFRKREFNYVEDPATPSVERLAPEDAAVESE